MAYFFTADEHYGHENIIKYCNRPFVSIEEMDATIIQNHNNVVTKNDTVIHVGDFTMRKKYDQAQQYIKQLNGNHVFIEGSHDYWLNGRAKQIWQKRINKCYVVACHYAMRVWPRSHYNTWLVYGHSHGNLPPEGKSWDVGVDNNNFTPVSFEQLKEIMDSRPDNFNLVKK